MNENLDEIISLLRKLPRKLEEEIDEIFPDTYAYIGRFVDNYSYDNNLPINSYDIKEIANKSFARINTNFLPEFESYIYQMIKKLQRDAEENLDLNKTLQIIHDNINDMLYSELNKQIHLAMMNFQDELNWNYSRKIDSELFRHLTITISSRLEEYMNENIRILKTKTDRQMEIIEDTYRRSSAKSPSEKPNTNPFEENINDIYIKYQEEINSDKSVSESFQNLKEFYQTLINRGITPDTIDGWDSNILMSLQKDFKEKINFYKTNANAKAKEEYEKAKMVYEEASKKEIPSIEKQEDTDISDLEAQISTVSGMENLSYEQKQMLINQILENFGLGTEPTKIEEPSSNKR